MYLNVPLGFFESVDVAHQQRLGMNFKSSWKKEVLRLTLSQTELGDGDLASSPNKIVDDF